MGVRNVEKRLNNMVEFGGYSADNCQGDFVAHFEVGGRWLKEPTKSAEVKSND